jgi:hypothetical protein
MSFDLIFYEWVKNAIKITKTFNRFACQKTVKLAMSVEQKIFKSMLTYFEGGCIAVSCTVYCSQQHTSLNLRSALFYRV